MDKKRADLRFSDGLKKIFNLLENSTDIDLVTDYGLWLVRHDSGLGIKVGLASKAAPTHSGGQTDIYTLS